MCLEGSKPLLTFRIQDIEFSGTKKYYLQNLNWIDAFPDPEGSFGKLCDNVLYLIKGEQAAVDKKNILPDVRTLKNRKQRTSFYVLGALAVVLAVIVAIFIFGRNGTETVTGKSYENLHGRNFVYAGEVKEGTPNGKGIAVYEAGEIEIEETGVVIARIREGKCTYKGAFVNGYREGLGTLTKTSEDGVETYEGHFYRNYKHGTGKIVWEDGDYFTGEFKHNLYWGGTFKSGNTFINVENGINVDTGEAVNN
jgi:hypothetical protein